jgi:hypothetical protein
VSEIPAALEKKVGPFPLVGWVGLVAGGAGLGYVLRRRSASKKKAPTAGSKLPTIDGVTAGAPSSSSSFAATGTRATTIAVPTPSQVTPTISATNQAWARNTINGLIALGSDPVVADTAVRKYLNGDPLNTAERSAIRTAIGNYGPPPEGGIKPITSAPDNIPSPPRTPTPSMPTPDQAPPSPAAIEYLVKPDDGDIAVFVTDYRSSITWVQDGYQARALANSGVKTAGQSPDGWPAPIPISRASLDRLPHAGPAPVYPPDYHGTRTAW